MTDQVTPEGGALPSDAPASQVEQQTDVTTAKPGSEADSSPAADPSEKKPDPRDERIKELTRHRRTAERQVDQLVRANQELTQRINSPQAAPLQSHQRQQPEDEITLASVGYDEKKLYTALAERAAREAAKTIPDVLRKANQEQDFESRLNAHEDRVSKFIETVDDFDPEDARRSMPYVHRDMAEAIMDSEESAAVEYYLWKNPDIARKIAELSPARAGREIQRIEDRLVAERKKAAAKPVSQAPPPAPSIEAKGDAGTRVSTTSPDSDKLSDAEWVKAEQARLNRKAKRQSG